MTEELAKERQRVTLGGKVFQVIDFDQRTVLQDHYLAKLVRVIGLDKVVVMDGETDTKYLIRLQTACLDSGRTPELIAGFLLPEGMTERDWSPAMARDIGAHIAVCNTEADRELVADLAMQCAFGFFRQGLERLNRLLFSLREEAASPTKSEAPRTTH